MALEPKQRAWVREFLKDYNATKAAIRAGYSSRSARTQGSRMLANDDVQAALMEAQERARERTGVTVDRIIEEYVTIAFARMSDIASWGADGLEFRDSTDLTDAALASIAEVKESSDPLGNRLLHVKLHSKLTALQALGKHLGMFAEQIEIKVQNAVEDLLGRVEHRLPPEAFAALVDALEEDLGFPAVAEASEEESGTQVH